MHAIIEDSGTQIQVAPGAIIDVDRRGGTDVKSGDTLTFDRVLLVGNEDDAGRPDGKATVGTPYVAGATVTAEVLDEIKGSKVDVVKFKRRKGYRVKQGHRQRYLRVRITDVKS